MDDYLKEAVELARAQAGVRVMSEDEIAAFIQKVAASLRALDNGVDMADDSAVTVDDAKKSIKEKSVTCLECGKNFKILTKRHLAQHGLTSEEYRDKYGLKKGTALVCKALQRERRKKMKDMQLWERRKKEAYKKS
jgi:predicted transcriptional regulator